MKAFREEMNRQIGEEVKALKAVREETLESVKALTQAQPQVCPAPAHISREVLYSVQVPLKRKRSEEDVDVAEEAVVEPRKVKRTRVMTKVLQTAGVFTVGAVATWSALAFS